MTNKEQTISNLKKLKSFHNGSYGADIDSAIEALEQTRWIPVSERLPESDGYYLVTEKSGRVCTYVFHKEGNSEEYWKRCTVAWMPLPKPYKAESEG